MQQLALYPVIEKFDTVAKFCEEKKIGEKDLILTNEYIYKPYFGGLNLKCHVVFQEKYGAGEPSDEMLESIYADIRNLEFDRMIAVGGGTIIDISKILSLKNVVPVENLYDRVVEIRREKELLIVPTTCGTGSEVTNISILELKRRKTKLGLADQALYADSAVLIPELLSGLPFKFFATSSIDALIHAVESFLSPKATSYTKMFSKEAIEMIIRGYKIIAEKGEDARMDLLSDFLIASNYAGIAFGNAGCAAVHAMSYPLGARYHVPHGESNYVLFLEVLRTYESINPDGELKVLKGYLKYLLGCDESRVFKELKLLLDKILMQKPMHEYGVVESDIAEFTENVMTKQGRLMANNYVVLDSAVVERIYKNVF